jgi:hypothetical protein
MSIKKKFAAKIHALSFSWTFFKEKKAAGKKEKKEL